MIAAKDVAVAGDAKQKRLGVQVQVQMQEQTKDEEGKEVAAALRALSR